ncbi:hypothetical protein ACRAWD_10185 [Caulobacter segnis]
MSIAWKLSLAAGLVIGVLLVAGARRPWFGTAARSRLLTGSGGAASRRSCLAPAWLSPLSC